MKTQKILRILAFILVWPTAHADRMENPGLETGDFSSWNRFGLGLRMGIGDDAFTGHFGDVIEVKPKDQPGFQGLHQEIPGTPGEVYNGSVAIRTVNVERSLSWFDVQFLDAEGQVLKTHQSRNIDSEQEFIQVTLRGLVAPKGAVCASIRGIVHQPEPSKHTEFHIFDDFEFHLKTK